MSDFVRGKYGLCYGCSPDIITAEKIELLLERIEKMKCCGNCKSYGCNDYECDFKIDYTPGKGICDKWEGME
jgi:hypothetical protein